MVLEQLGLASAPCALQFAELTGSPVRPRQQTAWLVRAARLLSAPPLP